MGDHRTGTFSRLAREVAELAACFDADPAAVELNSREVRARKETGLLRLQMDLMKNACTAHFRVALTMRYSQLPDRICS